MKRLVLVAALALALAPQAFAKGPVVLCGAGGCNRLEDETASAVRYWGDAGDPRVAPPAPAPFYKLEFADLPGVLAYWIPSAGVLRLSLAQAGPVIWSPALPDETTLLANAAAGLTPFAAPRTVTVAVDNRAARRPATYLRLYTLGTPVQSWRGARGWLPIYLFGDETPWTDGLTFMWISKHGSFLKRGDGDVMRIPARVAAEIRHRLPLTASEPLSVLVIRATWGPEPFTDADVADAVFDRAARFLATASFGRVALQGEQTPWLTAYGTPPPCTAIAPPALAAASAAGFAPAAYDRIVYLVPASGACDARAAAESPRGSSSTSSATPSAWATPARRSACAAARTPSTRTPTT